MKADRHGFGQRRVLCRESVRDRKQERLGEAHVLAVPAGILVRVPDGLDPAGPHHQGNRADDVAGPKIALCARSEVDDLGAELVTHHHRTLQVHVEDSAAAPSHVDELLRVYQGVEIGPAYPAGQGLHQHLARSGIGNLHLAQIEFVILHRDGSHGRHVDSLRLGSSSGLVEWVALSDKPRAEARPERPRTVENSGGCNAYSETQR